MSTIHRSRSLVFGIATVFTLTLLAPLAVTAEEEVAVMAPDAAPAVVGTSADDVRATRVLAAQSALQSGEIGSMQEDALFAIVVAAPSGDATSGSGAIEASRVSAAQHALQAGDLGSMQEAALLAVVAAGQSWDQTSGSGAVEASHAGNALPAAPAASTTAEQARVLAAQQALQSPDLGSLQEEALAAVVAASSAEVES